MKKKSTIILLLTLFLYSGKSQTYSDSFEKESVCPGDKNWHEVNDPVDARHVQSKSDSTILFRNLSAGIVFGPNFTGRYLRFNEPPQENQIRYEYMKVLNNRESSNYNFSGGLFARFECNNYIKVGTGFNLNRVSYSSSQLDSILIASDPSTGPVYSSGFYSFQYDVLSLPLEVLFNFLPNNKIVRPYFGIGILGGVAREKFLVNGSAPKGYSFLQYPTTNKLHTDLNCIAGFVVNAKRFVGFVEMNYRYGLTQKSAPYPISKVLFSFNLNIGFGFLMIN